MFAVTPGLQEKYGPDRVFDTPISELAMTVVRSAVGACGRFGAIEADVIDLRTLRPLDLETVAGSLTKTNRLMIIEEGPRIGGWSATLLAEIAEHELPEIDDVWRLATAELPIPFSAPLEDAFLPSAESVAASVRERLGVTVEAAA